MAIKKTKLLDSGVSGEYWKLIQVGLNAHERTCHWQFQLFLNASRKDGAGLTEFKQCSKENLTNGQMNGDLRALGYVTLKALNDPDITGGEDV